MSGEGSELTTMDIHQILKLLPHRYPFLLVDRVKELVEDSHIVALKNVSMNEPFFPGHYPHHPVMPGVLIIEALAQTCALLSYRSMGAGTDDNSVYYFVGIDNARFKRPVSPGDQMVMEAKLDGNKRGLWKFTTVARVDGLVVAEAQIICTVRAIEK